MITETPFEHLPEQEQDRLLAILAQQIRPMLGEIGEVVIKERNKKKPGFIGLLFSHGDDKAIVFAEFADEDARRRWRTKQTAVGKHVFLKEKTYIGEIIKAGGKRADGGLGCSDGLLLKMVADDENQLQAIFQDCYGEEVQGHDFKIKLIGKPLKKTDGQIYSMLYFALKDGDEYSPLEGLIEQLSKLVEQLIRNALGLAAISNQELRGAVSYLADGLPQSFNDYVRPQVLAAIYAYVREVVPSAMPAPEGVPAKPGAAGANELPVVEPHDAERANDMKSIHTASLIRVNRAVGGSLKGASVFSLSITTKAAHEGGSTTYSAIAKFSTLAEARDEADGLRRMQRYYSSIGKMLPPPLQVYLIADTNGKFPFEHEKWNGRWTELPCISVTPDLEGVVLSEKIAEHWASPTRRVERFGGYLHPARAFVEKIHQQPLELSNATKGSSEAPAKEEPQRYLADFFSAIRDSERERQRYKLLTTELNFPDGKVLKLSMADHGNVSVVNPAAWFGQMLDKDNANGGSWRTLPSRKPRSVLTHGDFHTGNLFFSTVGEHMTVLDYDRVGPGAPEEDLARLEASFVAFVFALPDFSKPEHWNDYALPSLALLAGCHPFPVQVLERNAFARDLRETLNVIRPAKFCPFYTALVIKALIIQLKTTCTIRDKDDRAMLVNETTLKAGQGRNAATWLYLAMLLGQLMETKDAPTDWKEPFNSALPKP